MYLIATICGLLMCASLVFFATTRVSAQAMTESQRLQLESLAGLISKMQKQAVDLQDLVDKATVRETSSANTTASSAADAICGLAGEVLKMDIVGRSGISIYTSIRECCGGLTKLPIYTIDNLGNCKSVGSSVGNGSMQTKNPLTGEWISDSTNFYWSNRVCAKVGDGVCGTGENKCNSTDCKTATTDARGNETCYVSNGRSYLKGSHASSSFYYPSGFDRCCIGRSQNNCTTLSGASSCNGIASVRGCDVDCKPILKCARFVANGSACNMNLDCKSGNCAEGVCCNDTQCGWGPGYGGATLECVNVGEQRSSDLFSGTCIFSDEYGTGVWVAN